MKCCNSAATVLRQCCASSAPQARAPRSSLRTTRQLSSHSGARKQLVAVHPPAADAPGSVRRTIRSGDAAFVSSVCRLWPGSASLRRAHRRSMQPPPDSVCRIDSGSVPISSIHFIRPGHAARQRSSHRIRERADTARASARKRAVSCISTCRDCARQRPSHQDRKRFMRALTSSGLSCCTQCEHSGRNTTCGRKERWFDCRYDWSTLLLNNIAE